MNEYYMLPLPDSTRYDEPRPFRVVERYERFVRLESVQYPSTYGFSGKYSCCWFPRELNTPMTADEIIRWAEKLPTTVDTRRQARAGIKSAMETIETWERYKDTL